MNFDPAVLELLLEAKYLYKMGLEVPQVALNLWLKEAEIKHHYLRSVFMLGSKSPFQYLNERVETE